MNPSGGTVVASSVIVASTISRSAEGHDIQLESSAQKRRHSATSPDSKRPRLASSIEQASSRRKSSIFDGADERKRGQKLFGNLLGTLGKIQQESSSTKAIAGASRRAEIEAKLAERLQREKQELAQKEKEQNDQKRREVDREMQLNEQKMEKGIMQTRHSQLLRQAHFLQTKCEPTLYYLPWKLSSEEEDQIDEQIARAKDQIVEEEDEQLRLKKDSEDEQVNQDEDANQESIRQVSESNNHSSGNFREKDELDTQMKEVQGPNTNTCNDTPSKDNRDDISTSPNPAALNPEETSPH